MMTNDAARAGDVLILTKPLGTGIITTALKRSPAEAIRAGGFLAVAYAAAVASMTMLNAAGAEIASAHGVRCGTDVTGFGLLGHLHKLALGSGVDLVLTTATMPLLPGVQALCDDGFAPGGTSRNVEFVETFVDWDTGRAQWEPLLADPQTSGGLVLCVAPGRVSSVLRSLDGTATPGSVIGEVVAAQPDRAGRIRVR
jgi:selenide, water dikinase